MSTSLRPPMIPPVTPDWVRKQWRVILDRFDRLDRAISAGNVHPLTLESRMSVLSQPEDFPAIAEVYRLKIHAAWVRSFAQYYARWAKTFPEGVVQHTEEGEPVTLREWVLMCEVGIAAQDRDREALGELSLKLARRFPASWVTHWAMTEANRLPSLLRTA
jgi:hypothetical protein